MSQEEERISPVEAVNDRVLDIVSEGLQETAQALTANTGEELLRAVLPAVAGTLAGPLASGAAAMTGAVVKAIFRQTSATERKLNKQLAAPFKTAARTVEDILSEQALTDAEEADATRRLEAARERLALAYTYAEDHSPERRLLVTVYQALVAALLEGGGAALRRYLQELRGLAEAARHRAAGEVAEADRVKTRGPGVVTEELEIWGRTSRFVVRNPFARESVFPIGLPSEEQINDFLRAREAGHRRRAAGLEKKAADMETLCLLLEGVHQNRRELLRAPKSKGPQTGIWKRLLSHVLENRSH